jgi:DNA-binding CsgD family transcriptional regulator
VRLSQELKALSADLLPALEELPIYAFLLDRKGRIRWMSDELAAIYGDMRGRMLPDAFIAPADRPRARDERTQKLLGVKRVSMYDSHLVLPDGTVQPVEINSVALDDGSQVVGIWGELHELRAPEPMPQRVSSKLTERQQEVLGLLGAGHSTKQIAKELNISVETVRSHVRAILTVLGAHSRLQAIAIAHQQGLI